MTDIRWTRLTNLGATTGSLADFLATYVDLAISKDGDTMAIADYNNDIVIASFDGGENWERLFLPIIRGDGFNPGGVIAANNGYIACISDSGDFITYNSDTQLWTTQIFPGTEEIASGEFAYSEDAQYILTYYLASSVYTLATSDDYGETWTTQAFTGKSIDGLSVNETGSAMYLTTHIGSPTSLADIYKSTDYGATWNIVNADIDISTSGTIWWIDTDDSGSTIAAAPSTPVSGWFSSDGGSSWTVKNIVPALNANSSFNGDISLSRDGTHVIFLNGESGVWLSDDFGDTWNENFLGYPSVVSGWYRGKFIGTSNSNISVISSLTADGDYTDGVLNPLYTSSDFGVTWNYNAVYADFDVLTKWLSASNNEANKLLLANNSTNITSVSSLLKSENSGSSWSYCTLPVESDSYMGLQMSETGTYMIAISYSYGRIVFSNDAGSSWTRIYPPGVSVEIPDTLTGYGLGVGVWMSKTGEYILISRRNWEGSLVYRGYVSKDYGVTWSSVGTPVAGITPKDINGDGSVMITYSSSIFYISTDYSDTWTNVFSTIKTASGESTFSIVKACCNYTTNIYALARAGVDYVCMFSSDSGTTWSKLGTLNYTQWNDVVSSYDGNTIIGTPNNVSDKDISLSLDAGDTWESVTDSRYTLIYNDMIFYDISSNEDGNRFISSTGIFPYLGRIGGGNIKSISGVPMESIFKVSGVLVSNLNKISGEQN